jgi:hypothetical protein
MNKAKLETKSGWLGSIYESKDYTARLDDL